MAIGSGRPSGRLASTGSGDKAATFGGGLVVEIAVSRCEGQHITGAEQAVLFLPGNDVGALDEIAPPIGRRVEEGLAVKDTGLPPNCQAGPFRASSWPNRPAFGQTGLGRRDRGARGGFAEAWRSASVVFASPDSPTGDSAVHNLPTIQR